MPLVVVMNKWFITVLFLLSTSLFLYQHSTGVSWDFSVFSLNADYLLTGRGYFEWGRPPLPAVLMFFGEYSYIILVSFIGLVACLKFCDEYDLCPEVFYALILSPYALFMGFQVGTEFLLLSLTLLFFAYISSGLGGFFLSLTVLTQYRVLLNSVFLFFSGRKFWHALLLTFLTFAPWLLFNFYFAGNPLYSLLDQYAKNIVFRSADFSFNFNHLLLVTGFALPLAVYGFSTSFNRNRRIDLMMVVLLVVKLVSYLFVPFKTARYLFDLIIPVAYFSARGLERFNYRVAFVITVLTFLFFTSLLPFFRLESPDKYLRVKSLINDSCMVLSNSWVFLDYFGVNAGPAPRQGYVLDRLTKGYTLVFFRNVYDPSYVFNDSFVDSLPVVINESEFFVVDLEPCLASYSYNLSFIEELGLDNPDFSFTVWDVIS